MRIKGREYGLRMTVSAAIAVEKVCPKGQINRIGDVLKGSAEDAVMNICRIAAALSRGFAESEAHIGRAAASATYTEVVGALADDLFFTDLVSEITETFRNDFYGTIETRLTKKGREAEKKQKRRKHRTLEQTLPWFLYFGRRHGMSREDVLNTRFSELQDLMTCDAVYHGLAEEVEKKKKLTQDEMLMLE